MNEDQTFKDIQSQIMMTRKLKQRSTDLIQPWMDEPQTIPIYLLKTESQKFTEKPVKMRKHASLQIYPKLASLSPRKQTRASKELPKKNIGNFTIIKIIQKAGQSNQSGIKKRVSNSELPTITVTRELAIERKLFLMKHKGQSPSPQRRSIRSIVESRTNK